MRRYINPDAISPPCHRSPVRLAKRRPKAVDYGADLPDWIAMSKGLSDAATPPLALEARGLTCERGERLLFSELNLAVDHGQMIQLEGANGSGKTSLLRILCGLAQPIDGEIYWNGTSTRKQRLEFLANVAYLSHYNGIKGELTPVENLVISRNLGVPARGNSIDDALEQVGLLDFDDQPCNSLSAGQKRRVSLARLLATDSPLWILDEPFTSLDVSGVALVEGMLRAHLGAGGLAIVTTHHPVDMTGHKVIKLRLGE